VARVDGRGGGGARGAEEHEAAAGTHSAHEGGHGL